MKKVRIALAGFGTVGTGLAKIIRENEEWIKKRTGAVLIIEKVLVRDISKPRPFVPHPTTTFTTNPAELLEGNPDILVELIGGTSLAYELIKKALEKGISVVTANKALLATRGKELLSLAEEKGVGLYFEASVGGGIPIVETLKESLAGNRITSITGILNGTANYILTQMSQKEWDFSTALAEAQKRGYAEADPTLDIEGIDAAHKLAILIFLAHGVVYPFEKLRVEGITDLSLKDISFAQELGYVFKLIAQVKEKSGYLQAGVFPALLPKNHILAKVDGPYNAILLNGNAVGPIMLYGQGAGDLPTGSAVLADIISLVKNNKQVNNTGFIESPFEPAKILEPLSVVSEHYFRFSVLDKPGVLAALAGVLGEYNISIAQAIQKASPSERAVPVVFLTHRARLKDVKKAIKEIDKFDFIVNPTVHYPILP
ncbi:MAG TPA: homoserine dehydrogenase [Desulfonauticus sp.]|nr:MAG: Homoserine dehydrogenase [Desulfonauticus sp. 38_4375]MDK2921104.1 homoserine dehydrogenase [Desulfonauticus sp.]HCO12214.1 homoserine dehydrogenase [Desulfonauticus sp.]